jgi:hypothetical protein
MVGYPPWLVRCRPVVRACFLHQDTQPFMVCFTAALWQVAQDSGVLEIMVRRVGVTIIAGTCCWCRCLDHFPPFPDRSCYPSQTVAIDCRSRVLSNTRESPAAKVQALIVGGVRTMIRCFKIIFFSEACIAEANLRQTFAFSAVIQVHDARRSMVLFQQFEKADSSELATRGRVPSRSCHRWRPGAGVIACGGAKILL